jgi:solute:Na+ symporter, SSS family
VSTFTSAKSVEALADLTYWTGTHRGIRIPMAALLLALVAIGICVFLSIVFR